MLGLRRRGGGGAAAPACEARSAAGTAWRGAARRRRVPGVGEATVANELSWRPVGSTAMVEGVEIVVRVGLLTSGVPARRGVRRFGRDPAVYSLRCSGIGLWQNRKAVVRGLQCYRPGWFG